MNTIVLKVSNEGVFWNRNDGVPWSATNLPAGAFRFREQAELYWEARQISYDAKRGQLRLSIEDYEVDAEAFDEHLIPKRRVSSIIFALLDEERFKAQLNYYRKGSLDPFWKSEDVLSGKLVTDKVALSPSTKVESKISVKFKYDFLELTIVNGAVTGKVELPGMFEPLPFRIRNMHLLAEFNVIKPFFLKALKRKLIAVEAKVVFVDDEPEIQDAISPQIARIDDKMLRVFRARSIRQLLGGKLNVETEKSLFTPEEFFLGMKDQEPDKVLLPDNGVDLLREILLHKEIRNARQLRYLADRLHLPQAPLRYVLKPNFGFVFLAEGQDGNHFILELLNSHATYVWSMPKSWKTLEEQYRQVEQEIQTIALVGRLEYRRSLRFEHDFWSLLHRHADSDLIDGFPRWRSELEEGLV